MLEQHSGVHPLARLGEGRLDLGVPRPRSGRSTSGPPGMLGRAFSRSLCSRLRSASAIVVEEVGRAPGGAVHEQATQRRQNVTALVRLRGPARPSPASPLSGI